MLKQWIFEVIQPDTSGKFASKLFDRFITLLILASVVSVFAGTFALPENVQRMRDCFESVASIIFTAEYLLRLWTSDMLRPDASPCFARLCYSASSMALVDLVAILPFWLPMLLPGHILGVRALRLVRLLRILKLNRYFDAMRSIGAVVALKRRELISSLFFLLILMLVSSLLMYSAEHAAQPEIFRNAFSGLWWAVATLTTVGYGDIYPVTVLGRLLGAVIAFAGIAAVAIPTGIITAGLTESLSMHGTAKDKEQDAEIESQRKFDEDHDRILKEHGELLKTIAERLDQISSKV